MVFEQGIFIGDSFVNNGEITPLDDWRSAIMLGRGAYESLKLKDGVLFFPEEHAERLIQSAEILSMEHGRTPTQVTGSLDMLIQTNQVQDARVVVLLTQPRPDHDVSLVAYLAKPANIDPEIYAQGVKLKTVMAIEDKRNPHAKSMTSDTLRTEQYHYARDRGAYDVLFYALGSNGTQVREGSRTNFFWTDGERLFTAPGNTVLLGVTRSHLMEHAQDQGIELVETESEGDLRDVGGALITATSIGAVPVREIDDAKISIPGLIRDLTSSFQGYLEDYAQNAPMRVSP